MNKVNSPKIKRESKNKIKVDFERTNWFKRFRLRFLTGTSIAKGLTWLFRFVLLLGISYVILFPFYTKIASSFMGRDDFIDVTVKLIPRRPTLDTYKAVIENQGYLDGLLGTASLSFVCAILQTFVCAIIGYGFAKYKFKGRKLLFALVVFSMVIPHQTLRHSFYMRFQNFDIGIGEFGILKMFGIEQIDMLGTYLPMVILSITGLAFKNGLFIFMLRQFFSGVPDELEESAYIDGYGPFKTFFKIIIPISIPMLITVFLFSFAWQWTDNFYVDLFGLIDNKGIFLLNEIQGIPGILKVKGYPGEALFTAAVYSTEAILIMLPLVVIYLFCQKYLVQGIERSGIVG
ncbi:MAG: carbohydrate ABC transporter permease [Clostridia bacterium]|nr:carbohydrate ABC transporter permease [Clostridia bacterium]